MNKKTAIIIGGTGQYGLTLGSLLVKKKFRVICSSRYNKKINFFKTKYPRINFLKLNIYNKNVIKSFILRYRPKIIFYFAGQSSPQISNKKKNITLKSNFYGCKNFLEIISNNNLKIKFFNAASSEMYGHVKNKININTIKKPLNPYGLAKKKSFDLVKKFRIKKGILGYNAIMFNTESILRNKNFLIPKICLGAINAYKNKKKLVLNNIITTREWNWCEEQCKLLYEFSKKKPQDFILSNEKAYSIQQMLIFAFRYFNLDYKDYVITRFKKLKKNEVKSKKSQCKKNFEKNNIHFKSNIFGKKLIYKMLKFYLNA